MSLTWGQQERVWSEIPELRKILEDKANRYQKPGGLEGQVYREYDLFTLNRIAEILILVEENVEEIIDNTTRANEEEMIKNFFKLMDHLDFFSRLINRKIDTMKHIMNKIERKVSLNEE
jgi:hypothetical protein